MLKISLPVHLHRGAANRSRQRCCLAPIPARYGDCVAILDQKPGDTFAEDAITAKDENLHRSKRR
jgi:hypothetical protein